MPFGKMKMFRNQQVMPQQNQVFRPPAAPGQFGGGNYTGMLDQSLQRFLPMMGGQGGTRRFLKVDEISNNDKETP